jgi:hypothetical protein
MGTWWSEHPDLEGVARRGRAEFEEEAAEAEADTEQLRQRRRSLIDVCFEWMSRGDLVTVAVGEVRFEGRLTAAVNDLVVVATKTVEASVNLACVGFVRSDGRGRYEGTTGNRNVSSFRACLGRFEVEGKPVRLVAVDEAFDVAVVIAASTEDHVLGIDIQGQELVLPRRNIAFAIAAS